MQTKVLSTADLEHLVTHQYKADDPEVIHLCTIVEALELIDKIKKGRINLTWDEFSEGYAYLRYKGIYFEPLDLACLQRSLFSEEHRYDVVHLWEPATDITIAPTDTIRRLILRPSYQTWWDSDSYEELETRF